MSRLPMWLRVILRMLKHVILIGVFLGVTLLAIRSAAHSTVIGIVLDFIGGGIAFLAILFLFLMYVLETHDTIATEDRRQPNEHRR